MPLIQGKSKNSFEHNIKTEMDSGKPQKQALAIAYDLKRKAMRKKMSKGGMCYDEGGSIPSNYPGGFNEDARRAFQKKAMGGMIENEDLNPQEEPEHSAEQLMMKEYDFSPHAEEHEEIEEPREPKDHYESDEEDRPGGMLGNVAQEILRKKMAQGGMMMAEGGFVEYPGKDYTSPRDQGEKGLRDTEIHNFGTDNETYLDEHPDDDYLSDEEQTPYFHPNDRDEFESSPKRKRMISEIMRGIARRHMGMSA